MTLGPLLLRGLRLLVLRRTGDGTALLGAVANGLASLPDVSWPMVPEARSLQGLLVGSVARLLGTSLRRCRAATVVTSDFAFLRTPAPGALALCWVWRPDSFSYSIRGANSEWLPSPSDPRWTHLERVRWRGDVRAVWSLLAGSRKEQQG